jgi:cell division septal protein FtsQ
MNPLKRIVRSRTKAIGPAKLESAARAKRARDHLARKRERERLRLERLRDHEAISKGRLRALAVLAPILFILAVLLGANIAGPVAELLLLRGTPLTQVAIQGAASLSPMSVAASAGALAGQSLHTIDPDSVGRAIASEPWIESARALRLPNGTLVVSIVERHAVARWRPDDSDSIELVDENGVPFPGALAPGGPLPLISGEADLTGGLPTEALEILGELKRYAALATDPSRLTLHLPGLVETDEGILIGSHAGYVLELGEAGPRALLGRRLFSQRVARLATLLDEDEAMVNEAQLIDLRYADRAVLRTEPASG